VSGAEPVAVDVVVEHEHGLHLRPAARFVRLAARFGAQVEVENVTRGTGRRANARSLLEVTTLGVDAGHVVRLTGSGPEAAAAVDALAALIRSGFAEPGER